MKSSKPASLNKKWQEEFSIERKEFWDDFAKFWTRSYRQPKSGELIIPHRPWPLNGYTAFISCNKVLANCKRPNIFDAPVSDEMKTPFPPKINISKTCWSKEKEGIVVTLIAPFDLLNKPCIRLWMLVPQNFKREHKLSIDITKGIIVGSYAVKKESQVIKVIIKDIKIGKKHYKLVSGDYGVRAECVSKFGIRSFGCSPFWVQVRFGKKKKR